LFFSILTGDVFSDVSTNKSRACYTKYGSERFFNPEIISLYLHCVILQSSKIKLSEPLFVISSNKEILKLPLKTKIQLVLSILPTNIEPPCHSLPVYLNFPVPYSAFDLVIVSDVNFPSSIIASTAFLFL
jgi:hypothetical protein